MIYSLISTMSFGNCDCDSCAAFNNDSSRDQLWRRGSDEANLSKRYDDGYRTVSGNESVTFYQKNSSYGNEQSQTSADQARNQLGSWNKGNNSQYVSDYGNQSRDCSNNRYGFDGFGGGSFRGPRNFRYRGY